MTRRIRLRAWLLALDLAHWLGCSQGGGVYLWIVGKCSDAVDWGEVRG